MPSDLPPRPPRTPRSRSASGGGRGGNRARIVLAAVLGAVVLLFLSARTLASFYVDLLWFNGQGRSDVFWGVLWARVQLALGFSLLFAVLCFVMMVVADRVAPPPPPIANTPEEQVTMRYRAISGGRRTLLRVVVALVVGLMAGLPASAQWESWLLFRNQRSFGITDPQFNTDVGFYIFRLPFLQFLVGWLFAATILLTVVTAAVHYLNGGIRVQSAGPRLASATKVHLSAMFAVLALLNAARYWLQRFELTTSGRGVVQGATYTDVNAQLPALNLLILVSLAVAVLFLVNTRQRGWRLPVLAVGLWAVVAVVAGTVYPAVVQRFIVQPNVSTRELPYIGHNLDATTAAFRLDGVAFEDLPLRPITTEELVNGAEPLTDVRLLEPVELRDRFALDQGLTSFYSVRDLDVDRYEIDGRVRQVMIGARELNLSGIPNNTWVSRHLLYTHGCGVVVAPASQVTDDGRPAYLELDIERPQLYVGDRLGGYSVVGTAQREQPCPGTVSQPYEGGSGVRLSSFLRRVAFAVHFGEFNLFGSNLIQAESEILFIRDVRDRIDKVAPFLHLDSDPYPVVYDRKLVWVVDAFTTTNRYPYSQRASTAQLTAGSGLNHDFNYVRNSVKAVVDAYTGEVTLYVVDESDPIIAAWRSAFPKLFTSNDQVPDSLRRHFRYPDDLFRVQTNMYGRYRFDNPEDFFNRDAAWSVAQGPSRRFEVSNRLGSAGAGQVGTIESLDVADANVVRFEPYYTLFHAPNQPREADPVFSLLRPFVPFSADDSRKELRAFMTVSSDPDTYGQLTVYTVAGPLPPGPATVAAEVDSDPVIAPRVNLLAQQGSRVVFGDLQVVPVSEGLLYVRPLYVRPEDSSAQQVFLRHVVVSYNNRSVLADTLTEAVKLLFPAAGNLDLGQIVDDGSTPVTPVDPSTPQPPDQPGGPDEAATAAELLARADVLFAEAESALPDFATYQLKLEQAKDLVRRALQLLDDAGRLGG
jgi:uncharacterized protein